MDEEDWTDLRKDVGKMAEAAGRMLRRDKAFTKQDLTELRDTLNYCGETVQSVRDHTFK